MSERQDRIERVLTSGKLPSPTGTAMTIMQMTADESVAIGAIAKAIQSDPALSGRLLHLANSSARSRSRPAVSVQDAVLRLGVRCTRNVALGFSLITSTKQGKCIGFPYDDYWSNSLAMAVAAQIGCHYIKQIPEDDAFTCGLLGNIGILALATAYPDSYGGLIEQASLLDHAKLEELELKYYGFTHSDLTFVLMKDWGLPKVLCLAAKHHDAPDDSGLEEGSRERNLAHLLHVADSIGMICAHESRIQPSIARVVERQAAEVNISLEVMEQIYNQSMDGWREWGKSFNIQCNEPPEFSFFLDSLASTEETTVSSETSTKVVFVGKPQAPSIAEYFREAAYEVETMENLDGAAQPILALNPQAVIIQGKTSDEIHSFCRWLQADKTGRSIYVIVLRENVTDSETITLLDDGVDDVCKSPVNLALLAAKVRVATRTHELHLELRRDQEAMVGLNFDLDQTNQKLKGMTRTDYLTGFQTRFYAQEKLHSLWKQKGDSLACMVVRVDGIRKVNRTHGLASGDSLLRRVANLLRKVVDQEDSIFRMDGTAFLVFSSFPDPEFALQQAERVREMVSEDDVVFRNVSLPVTVSIGVAFRGERLRAPDELVCEADQAAVRARELGGNRICAASPVSDLATA